jgi:hypothetical protein
VSRPLAKRYVVVVHGRTFPDGEEFVGDGRSHRVTWRLYLRNKRQAMRSGKVHARELKSGATVTLRADSHRGPIIERVKLSRDRRRWEQAFET